MGIPQEHLKSLSNFIENTTLSLNEYCSYRHHTFGQIEIGIKVAAEGQK